LLDKGAAIEAKRNGGFTPLYIAAEKGHLDVVSLLLEKGAVADAKNYHGFTLLYSAAEKGKLDVVKLLLEKGAGIDAKVKGGFTPLHVAADKGHFDVVKLLLDKGAAVDSKSDYGRTPLSFAVQNEHLEVVKLLLDKGAAVDSKDRSYTTPLMIAAANGSIDLVKVLLDRGAAVVSMDRSGATPLMIAAEAEHPEAVALLAIVPVVITVDPATLEIIHSLGPDAVFLTSREHPLTRLADITDSDSQIGAEGNSDKVNELMELKEVIDGKRGRLITVTNFKSQFWGAFPFKLFVCWDRNFSVDRLDALGSYPGGMEVRFIGRPAASPPLAVAPVAPPTGNPAP
jgi:ankyrin repeat protein